MSHEKTEKSDITSRGKLVSPDDPSLVTPPSSLSPDGSTTVFDVGPEAAAQIGTDVEPTRNNPLWMARLVMEGGKPVSGVVNVTKGTVEVKVK